MLNPHITTAPTVGSIANCYGTGYGSQDRNSFRGGNICTASVSYSTASCTLTAFSSGDSASKEMPYADPAAMATNQIRKMMNTFSLSPGDQRSNRSLQSNHQITNCRAYDSNPFWLLLRFSWRLTGSGDHILCTLSCLPFLVFFAGCIGRGAKLFLIFLDTVSLCRSFLAPACDSWFRVSLGAVLLFRGSEKSLCMEFLYGCLSCSLSCKLVFDSVSYYAMQRDLRLPDGIFLAKQRISPFPVRKCSFRQVG